MKEQIGLIMFNDLSEKQINMLKILVKKAYNYDVRKHDHLFFIFDTYEFYGSISLNNNISKQFYLSTLHSWESIGYKDSSYDEVVGYLSKLIIKKILYDNSNI